MTKRFRGAVIAGALLLGAVAVEAQTRADSAAVLLGAAQQLRDRGEAGAAHAVLDLIARQYAGTAAAAEVERMRQALARLPEVERSGRTELLVWGTGYGAWLGIAAPLIADADGPEAYGLGFLIGAPAGFLAARQYANARPVSEGQARALTFGGSWGTYQGFGWAEVLKAGTRTHEECYHDGECYTWEESDAAARVASGVVGGLAGIGAGALLARKPISAGTAATVSLGGMWGSWFGFGVASMVDLSEDQRLTGALLAGNAALLATALADPQWQLSETRARLISLGGLIGGLAGVGVMLIVQPDDEQVAIGFPVVGSAIGLGAAAILTRESGPLPRLREPPEQGAGGALLNLDAGRWALAVPDAGIRLHRTRNGLATGAYVPLLRARFR